MLCVHHHSTLIGLDVILIVLWRTLIVKHNGIVHTQLDVSSLAKVTDGYTPGHLVEVGYATLV